MYYQLFLQILIQFSSKETATIAFENGTIYIQSAPGKTTCRISTPLFKGNGSIPAHVRSCVSSRGNLHWQKTGAYLQFESATQTLVLIDEIEIKKDKYLSFKKKIHDF